MIKRVSSRLTLPLSSALVFILVLVVIIIATIVRKTLLARRHRQAFRAGRNPEPTPGFSEVARDVSRAWLGGPRSVPGPSYRYDPRRSGDSHYPTHPAERAGPPVMRQRDPEMGDPDLPSYYDNSTFPHPPPAVYSSPIQARRDGRSTTSFAPPVHDGAEPPKYDLAMRE
ncbi:hypothetical protein BD324DRAFT_650383 [Kockovaella imperatae]|uniref:Uncharacterized protein n=1 Tax=Kockovaella imperatae TaxID=4999 RepID=A0A1Y1UIG7_9TREE|nr:hypothetical protein BD324DRAFT_650383 [Kockovaella imperatae]ORX37838.1 hypothetical protein BD324DRAFT_650383 [Kockovaella imperatae]